MMISGRRVDISMSLWRTDLESSRGGDLSQTGSVVREVD